ncbi:ParA family protein [Parasegetibacter sp. NRK P23]|uniref:ParA family protein n=1 Tax=Parasegetibacter sp. NRK P23 TaxID=2942999 RepID=UPI0020444136|nr:ParA family protein [Parasegetibacter sp. NRK P23]MCM5529856.1 ParA family protein [Parasegetibacter sp. NRK P23]
MVTIALYNLKGGVGKTASCVNFAWLAAQDGYKTLLWDLDPQGSTTFYYQAKPRVKGGMKKLMSKEIALEEVIMATDYENIDIIPADISARNLDIILGDLKSSKKRLKSIIQELEGEYDFVFIDCPPGFSVLSENIFIAADIILMPTIPTTLSVRTYQIVKDYFEERELDLSKMMCFFTMVDRRKSMHQDIMEELYKDNRFFWNFIPYLSDVEKMGIHQAPVAVFARSSYAAQCYSDLWQEIKEGVLE